MREQDVLGLWDVVHAHRAVDCLNVDCLNIVAAKAVRIFKRQGALHRRVRRDVRRVTLHHDRFGQPRLAQAFRERIHVVVAAKHFEESELALKRRLRSREAIGRQQRGHHTGF